MTGSGDEWPGSGGADWAMRLRRGLRLADSLGRAADAPVEIATTPKDEVWRDGKVSLHRYRPLAEASPFGPLLILQGLIGRQTITDLEPDRSLVRRLLEGGTDLWVLDWGNPSRADMHLTIADYAEFWLGDALAAIRERSGRARAALLGICQGGVFALCHAARHPDGIAGVVPMVTPVDFHADRNDPDPGHGILNLWARNLPEALIERWIAERGCLPGELTGAVFQLLTPARTAAKSTSDLLELGGDEAALATYLRMERWLADRPDHPGAAAREWLIDLYQQNRLAAGTFAIEGRPVDLSRIACPVLNVHARDDHIVPAPCATALEGLVPNAPYRALEVPTGHIGVFVSRTAQGIVPPAILDWLAGLDHGAARA